MVGMIVLQKRVLTPPMAISASLALPSTIVSRVTLSVRLYPHSPDQFARTNERGNDILLTQGPPYTFK